MVCAVHRFTAKYFSRFVLVRLCLAIAFSLSLYLVLSRSSHLVCPALCSLSLLLCIIYYIYFALIFVSVCLCLRVVHYSLFVFFVVCFSSNIRKLCAFACVLVCVLACVHLILLRECLFYVCFYSAL